ncbi:hypothetical protein HY095_05205 [Candidatus Micrarchaeota archaeon]|nr:hypothetical protein [Candidatus Micrarchaeota archaeon]
MNKLILALAFIVLLLVAAAYYVGAGKKTAFLDSSEQAGAIPVLAIVAVECQSYNATCGPEFAAKFSDCFPQADAEKVTFESFLALDPSRSCISSHAQNEGMRRECVAYVDAVKAARDRVKAANEALLAAEALSTPAQQQFGLPCANNRPAFAGNLQDSTGIAQVRCGGNTPRDATQYIYPFENIYGGKTGIDITGARPAVNNALNSLASCLNAIEDYGKERNGKPPI